MTMPVKQSMRVAVVGILAALLLAGCHREDRTGKASEPAAHQAANVPKVVDGSMKIKEDVVGHWRVQIGFNPGTYPFEVMSDGTFKGNGITGKWYPDKNGNIVFEKVNGGQDITMRFESKTRLSGPADGFQFNR